MVCLVTGNRGFVGSRLEQYLKTTGESVCGFDMLGDYPTVELLTNFMKDNKIEKVYHLGARAFIPSCFSDAILNVVNSNVTFTSNLLVASKRVGVRKFLYFSTSEIYGNQPTLPIGITNAPNPQSTYAASKYAAESLCRTFGRESCMDVCVLRHFNIYGPHDTQPRIIPKIMASFKHNRTMKLGNINVTRDFTYVEDACIAARNVMEYSRGDGDIFVHGSGVETSIRELIKYISELYDKPGDVDNIVIDEYQKRPWDVERLLCDRTDYEMRIGNHKPIDIKTGLKLTKEWYDNNAWPWEIQYIGK